MAIHHSWFQSFVSKLFPDGLNQGFDIHCQLIFSKSQWPSHDDIISSIIIEEETRLAHPEGEDQKVVDIGAAALSIQNSRTPNSQGDHDKTKIICDHYGRAYHREVL